LGFGGKMAMGKDFLWVLSVTFHQCSTSISILILILRTSGRSLGSIKPSSAFVLIFCAFEKIKMRAGRSPVGPVRFSHVCKLVCFSNSHMLVIYSPRSPIFFVCSLLEVGPENERWDC
jgi:hypothetical protein